MSFFDNSVPPLCLKPTKLDSYPQGKVFHLCWRRGKHRFFSRVYTRVDLACLLWALILIPIFVTPQFFPVSWTVLAGLWSGLSLVGLAAMVAMSQYWVKLERVSWVLYCWVILMLVGLLVTNLGPSPCRVRSLDVRSYGWKIKGAIGSAILCAKERYLNEPHTRSEIVDRLIVDIHSQHRASHNQPEAQVGELIYQRYQFSI